MTTKHKNYLNLAFNIAEQNLGKTKLNPSVGTIIVKNDSVISTGITSLNGRPHSEYNALKKKGNFFGANLYTTLEPCTHFGLTPPCVNMIVKKKIKNVYYGSNDPDPRTFKKAKKFLRKNKIGCRIIKNKKFDNFYSSYFFNRKYKSTHVSAKIAISKDFYTISKKSKWITNEHSRKISHLLRSKHDCIISTSKTINVDNALLNCRINGLMSKQPDLFIIDLNLKLKKKLLINKLTINRKTFLVTKKKFEKKTSFFKKKGFKILFVESLSKKEDFKSLFYEIYKLGYSRSFFETGLTFLNTLLRLKILNILYIFKNNNKLKKNGLNNCGVNYLKKMKLKEKININLKNNVLYKIKF